MTDALWAQVFLLAGAPAFGSFLGLLADRAGTGRGVVFGGSRCDHCGRPLGARDLAPLLSWIAAAGRARCCGKPLRLYHPLVEATALGVVALALAAAEGWRGVVAACLGLALLGVALLDLESGALTRTAPRGGAAAVAALVALAAPPWALLAVAGLWAAQRFAAPRNARPAPIGAPLALGLWLAWLYGPAAAL